jgi:putative endonuclease
MERGDSSGQDSKGRRRRSQRRGHVAEFAAAAFLIAKGHRILARRFKTPAGEIDLIAVKGKRLRFVEVKQRPTIAECEAAISPRSRQRVYTAADLWMARQPSYQSYDVSFDLVFVTPWSWPRHLTDSL